jgi:uncharacterized protein (DUF952 family)
MKEETQLGRFIHRSTREQVHAVRARHRP